MEGVGVGKGEEGREGVEFGCRYRRKGVMCNEASWPRHERQVCHLVSRECRVSSTRHGRLLRHLFTSV